MRIRNMCKPWRATSARPNLVEEVLAALLPTDHLRHVPPLVRQRLLLLRQVV